MNSYRILPKLSLKKLACENSYFMDKTRMARNAMRKPPEVPLTKVCNEEYATNRHGKARSKAPNSYACPAKGATTTTAAASQRQTLSGLSNWYTNHLTAMDAIQKFKAFRQDKDCESQNYYDKLANFNYSKSLKYKRQAAGPHMDLENYLNSLRSRQKELSGFRKQSRAWERYFEKSIPGWRELKQRKKIDVQGMAQLLGSGSAEGEADSKPGIELVSTKRTSRPQRVSKEDLYDAELIFKRASLLNDPSSLQPKQPTRQSYAGVKLSQEVGAFGPQVETARTPIARVAAVYADIESKARKFFQQLPEARNERKGHVNNETMFDELYGKYLLTKDEKPKSNLKKPPKITKHVVSSDILLLKKLRNEKKAKSQNPKSIKLIENMIKSREKERKVMMSKVQQKAKKKKPKQGRPSAQSAPVKRCSPSAQQRSPPTSLASPLQPLLIEVTNDPKFFKQKLHSKSSPARVLLVGKQQKRPSQQKSQLTQKLVNDHRMLVVEASKRPAPKAPQKPSSPTSFLSFAKSNWGFNP